MHVITHRRCNIHLGCNILWKQILGFSWSEIQSHKLVVRNKQASCTESLFPLFFSLTNLHRVVWATLYQGHFYDLVLEEAAVADFQLVWKDIFSCCIFWPLASTYSPFVAVPYIERKKSVFCRHWFSWEMGKMLISVSLPSDSSN